VSEARKSLDIVIAPETAAGIKKPFVLPASIDWRANLRAGHLSTTGAWYALTHTISSTVEYAMMATASRANAKKVMRPFLNADLSLVSFSQMRVGVVWGPRPADAGIQHLYDAGVEHLLNNATCHARYSLLRQLLRTSMEEMQL
jgi:hypothetical protein